MATNPVVHFEIPGDDLDRAKAFYSGVFDWKITHVPDFGYTAISTQAPGEGIDGGLVQRGKPFHSTAISIRVDDIDAALRKVEDWGGKTVQAKKAIGSKGFVAYICDTEDNLVALLQLNE